MHEFRFTSGGSILSLQPSASKKIPENPRYKHVKSCIDTGEFVSKLFSMNYELYNLHPFRSKCV